MRSGSSSDEVHANTSRCRLDKDENNYIWISVVLETSGWLVSTEQISTEPGGCRSHFVELVSLQLYLDDCTDEHETGQLVSGGGIHSTSATLFY